MTESAVSVRINEDSIKDVRRLINQLKGNTKVVQLRAYNRGVRSAEKLTADALYGRLNLTKRKIREYLNMKLATQAHLSAKLVIESAGIPLLFYGARAGVRGVTFKIWRAEGRSRYKHAFQVEMDTGHEGIFERRINDPKYDGRLPISEKMGPGVATVFEKEPTINNPVAEGSAAAAIKEMERQVQYILDKNK